MDRFAAMLRDARQRLNLTQGAVADLIATEMNDGCDLMQVSKWERGEHRPDRDRLPVIVSVLQLDAAQAMEAYFTPTAKQIKAREALAGPVRRRASANTPQLPPTPKRRGNPT